MKVKCLVNEGSLQYEGIYNVFSIEEKNGKSNYYISLQNDSDFDIAPFNSDYFEIVENSISKFWLYGLNQFGETCIGPEEVFEIKDFWWKYSESDNDIHDILSLYYSIGKNELFNIQN